MADGSNGNRGQTLLWQCQYCPKNFLGVRPGTFDYCPKCGKEQKQDPTIPEILCINPECEATLFSEKAETCHICHVCQKPQQQKPAATPTDSSKQEEHKLKIAQAVQAKKQQSQESETTTEMAAHGTGGAAENQSAAEPQKGGAPVPPNAPTLKEGETPENPIVIDSANATTPGKGTSAEAGPNSKSVNVNKSATEGTTEPQNVNIDGQKTNQPPKNPGDPAAANEKGKQDQPPGDPNQKLSSTPDSNKLDPDSSSPKSTGSSVPDSDLARMSIDDVRPPSRKRSHEGDGERPPSDSSTPSTYAAAAKTPATATQALQTSVPPVKKQRNNTSNEKTPTSDQENVTPRPPSNLNQSTDPQVCVTHK